MLSRLAGLEAVHSDDRLYRVSLPQMVIDFQLSLCCFMFVQMIADGNKRIAVLSLLLLLRAQLRVASCTKARFRVAGTHTASVQRHRHLSKHFTVYSLHMGCVYCMCLRQVRHSGEDAVISVLRLPPRPSV